MLLIAIYCSRLFQLHFWLFFFSCNQTLQIIYKSKNQFYKSLLASVALATIYYKISFLSFSNFSFFFFSSQTKHRKSSTCKNYKKLCKNHIHTFFYNFYTWRIFYVLFRMQKPHGKSNILAWYKNMKVEN